MSVYNFNFGSVSLPSAASDPWQSSPSAARTGVRSIKIICAVGSFLHFRESE